MLINFGKKLRHAQGILQLKFQTNAKEDEILT